jgi:hypothetical protein
MLSTKYITDYIIIGVLWWKMEGNGVWSIFTDGAVMSSSNQPSSQTPYQTIFNLSNPNIAWIIPIKPLFVKS